MAVYKRDIVDINLETGNIHRSFLKHSIGYMDQKADHFGVRVFRNGEPVNLTGVSVQGVFMPPQGSPIAITTGNIVSDNVAEVVLPQACYNYDGQFTLAIKLVDSTNEVTGTVRIVDGMVDNTHASGTVAPTSAVPTYQEVLSAYEQAIAVIGASVRFDQTQSLTDAQKATARSNIGAPSTAEMNTALALKVNVSDIENDLTGTTAGKVLDARQGKVLDDKVSDLKSALEDETGTKIIDFVKGKFITTSGTTVTLTPTNNSIWSYAVVDCSPGDVFTVTGYGGGSPRLWCFIDSASPANVIGVQAAANASLFDAELVAPLGATRLVLNKILGQNIDHPCYKGSIVKNVTGAISEKSPNLVSMTNGSVTSAGVKITRSNGKLTLQNSKTSTGYTAHKFSNEFTVPAGDYYFGTRYGSTDGIYLQLCDWTGGAFQSIIKQTKGFTKVTLENDTQCTMRVAFTDGINYNTDLFPEIIPVGKLQDYTPQGLLAVDDLARSQNAKVNSGFVSRFPQKRFAVIGDSMSSYKNDVYCDSAYTLLYPAFDVYCVEQTWWKMVADASNAVIAFNESEGGAFVTNQRGVVIPGSDRPDFYDRVLSLKARNVNPDMLFVALGHNDSSNSIALGDYDFTTTYTSLSEATFRTAYIKGIKAIQSEFPGTKIVCVILSMGDDYSKSIEYIADKLGCEYVYCKSFAVGSDNVHPNAIGMRQIASGVLNKPVSTLTLKYIPTTDLQDATEPAIYGLDSTVVYANSPLENGSAFTGARMLQVYPSTVAGTAYLVQVLWVLSGTYAGNIYIRRRTGSVSSFAWTDWLKISSIKDAALAFIEQGNTSLTDLNDATAKGYYNLIFNTDYDNLPEEVRPHTSGALTLFVYSNDSNGYILQELMMLSSTYAGNIYVRRKTVSGWTTWTKVSSIKDMNAGFDKAKFVTDNTILKNYDYTQRSSQGANVGTNIRVMSYNLAHFTFDTSTHISAEKLGNLHKLLMNVNADFLCLQEDDPYIDSGDTKLSNEYLYYPMYPVSLIDDMYPNHNITGTNVRSKRSFVSRDSLEFTESHRPLRYCVYSIDGKTLLLISAHPGLTEEERAGQYEELFKWINGDITLNRYYTETAVSVPEFTHCIIGMDSNSATDTDRTNLTSEATTAGYKMANGGVLGWIDTEYKYEKVPIDNILVSGNVIINNIEVLSGWYDLLYSDHVPIFCDVTLIDS